MGRIKNSFVKHIGKDIFEKYPDMFTTNFGKNKEVVEKLLNIKSKRTRNILVGYMTTLVKAKNKV